MKLFSKRHIERRVGIDRLRYRMEINRNELITSEARTRLVAQIKFITSRNDFLEFHILFEDKRHDPSYIYYDKDKLDDFSKAELGYRMSDYFDFEDFTMRQSTQDLKYGSENTENKKFYDDYKLFDLVEITILFSKALKRKDVIGLIGNVLKEESTDYEIVEHLITRKSGDDLKSITGIIKDEDVKNKIERFYDYFSRKDYKNAAKISADILNILYSDDNQKKKKEKIEKMKLKLVNNSITNTKDDKKVKMSDYFESMLRLAKNLNDNIYDIRHTEKHTLKPRSDNLYKVAAQQNIIVIETTLTALKDDFVLSDDWEQIKNEYVKKYQIDTNIRRIYKPREPEVDLSEIPF